MERVSRVKSIVVSGELVGLTAGGKFALACNVIPMGWLNSVGIMQERSENLVKQPGICLANQIGRGRPLPIWFNDVPRQSVEEDRAWFHIYLNNFCEGEQFVQIKWL